MVGRVGLGDFRSIRKIHQIAYAPGPAAGGGIPIVASAAGVLLGARLGYVRKHWTSTTCMPAALAACTPSGESS